MEKRYVKTHEWIKGEGGVYEIGISDYAQDSLGDIVFVDFPKIGKKVTKGSEFCSIESVKAVSDLYSPIDGEVVEINEKLKEESELLNKAAEETWIVKIKSDNPVDLGEFLKKEEYEDFIDKDAF